MAATLRIIIEGGVIQDIENVDGSIDYLEVEIIDRDDNREEGLNPDEISTVYVIERDYVHDINRK